MTAGRKAYFNTPPLRKVRRIITKLNEAGQMCQIVLDEARLSDGDSGYLRKIQRDISSIGEGLKRNLITPYQDRRPNVVKSV